jgi:hypothetical protein
MAVCKANIPHAHAVLNHHSSFNSLERNAAKEGLAMVAAAAAAIIG